MVLVFGRNIVVALAALSFVLQANCDNFIVNHRQQLKRFLPSANISVHPSVQKFKTVSSPEGNLQIKKIVVTFSNKFEIALSIRAG